VCRGEIGVAEFAVLYGANQEEEPPARMKTDGLFE
jgi:hypothetical protein